VKPMEEKQQVRNLERVEPFQGSDVMRDVYHRFHRRLFKFKPFRLNKTTLNKELRIHLQVCIWLIVFHS